MVKTPSYWKEEQYQPLIEETTYYGNPVLIPKRSQLAWKYLIDQMNRISEQYGPENAVGWLKERLPQVKKHGRVLRKVFIEEYEE